MQQPKTSPGIQTGAGTATHPPSRQSYLPEPCPRLGDTPAERPDRPPTIPVRTHSSGLRRSTRLDVCPIRCSDVVSCAYEPARRNSREVSMRPYHVIPVVPALALVLMPFLPFVNTDSLWLGLPRMMVWGGAWCVG